MDLMYFCLNLFITILFESKVFMRTRARFCIAILLKNLFSEKGVMPVDFIHSSLVEAVVHLTLSQRWVELKNSLNVLSTANDNRVY
ncbi:hypothetical protein VNO77_31965 [Canavalia gladiata]|uniref:Uncharacterized protein n=1 Tax=Canavalia gladiata TaxID=3824 RepID=A0AAN9KPE1_CANGL